MRDLSHHAYFESMAASFVDPHLLRKFRFFLGEVNTGESNAIPFSTPVLLGEVERLSNRVDNGGVRTDRATMFGVGCPKDADRFHSQRRRYVHRAGVDANDTAGTGQHRQQFTN